MDDEVEFDEEELLRAKQAIDHISIKISGGRGTNPYLMENLPEVFEEAGEQQKAEEVKEEVKEAQENHYH